MKRFFFLMILIIIPLSVGADMIERNPSTGTVGTGSIQDDEMDYTSVTLNDFTFDVGSVTKTEFGYLSGVTSSIQDQIDGLAGGHAAVTLDANVSSVFTLNTQEFQFGTQTANTVFAGPASGAAAVPTMRALVAADIPDISGTYQPLLTNEASLYAVLSDVSDFVQPAEVDMEMLSDVDGEGTNGAILTDNGDGTYSFGTGLNISTLILPHGTDTAPTTIADVYWNSTTDVLTIGNGSTALTLGTMPGPAAGSNYTNYGAAGDDTIDELFAAIDTSWPSATGAPTDAQYFALATNASLSAERTLNFGTDFSTTDNGANGSYDVDLSSTMKADAIEFVIDGGGSAITTGVKGFLEIPYACTITRVTTLADQSGSIAVDLWVDSYANFPPTDADSITSSTPPTLSTAQAAQDSTLTSWTTSLSAGDIIGYNVDSAATVKRVTISLLVDK